MSALRIAFSIGSLLSLAAFTPPNLVSGDGGRTGVQPDLSALNLVRVIYGSEGGMGEAYYRYDGRIWARWETDFPGGDDNLAHRLGELTRARVNPKGASRFLTAPDLGDFPLLFMSDPGWMVLSKKEKQALAQHLGAGGFLWVDDFWGESEWKQFERNMSDVLPGRTWQVLAPDHPIFHTVYDLEGVPQIPALEWTFMSDTTAEYGAGHKMPTGSLDQPQMRAWLDDNGRVLILATHNTDIGDGWEREAYGQAYFERFSTRAYMVATNVVAYAMTH
jgi:hypothetical protein